MLWVQQGVIWEEKGKVARRGQVFSSGEQERGGTVYIDSVWERCAAGRLPS